MGNAVDFEAFDNRSKILRDDLVKRLAAGDRISLAAAYFSIFGYQELRCQLNDCEEVRFLYTEPTFLKGRQDKAAREFFIPRQRRERGVYGTDLEIRLRNEMTQRAIARECADWIRAKVIFRSLKHGEGLQSFLEVEHSNAVQDADREPFVYTPVSGLTASALGTAPSESNYTCIMRNGAPMSTQLLQLFNEVWMDEQATEDVTDQVIESITTLYQENPPELIYYAVLQDIFEEFLDNVDDDLLPKEIAGFRDSKIWGMLYDFQRDAALAIINKLETYNGCILADSVGLGKTYTALAVIKYYEARQRNVLVLCPKKLRDNWFTFRSNVHNNPIAADHLRYDVLYHTDLSRDRGMSESGIDLATINWENYDLVVIDESHNFRNGGDSATGDRENRYQRLMSKVIGSGIKTRVLMLSATPVNNRFRDLQNQLELAYRRSDVNWQDALGLRNDVKTTFRNAQAVYAQWAKMSSEERTTTQLMDMLDADFFKLLDQVTVARSRKQIMRYYDVAAIGPFPKRLKPISHRPALSSSPDVASFSEIAHALDVLNLAVYIPSAYLQPSKASKYEREGNLSLTGRESGVRRLMAVNLLKRLESSVHAFRLTVTKVLSAVEEKIALVDEFEHDIASSTVLVEDVAAMDLDGDDENVVSHTKIEVALSDIDWIRWREDMRKDLQTLRSILDMVVAADPAHDAKLLELERVIADKVQNPINRGNRKLLIFTSFADTANYLFEHISRFALSKLGLHTAVVTGDRAGVYELKGVPADTQSVLACFSPKSKTRSVVAPQLEGKDIDILIATDCISEGQNLQDCDCVVNYDIHWNPVRIVQRFGRVDRIGSTNACIQLVNFWPDVELDEYINLKARVETRMRITVMTSTGDDDYLNPEEQGDLEYRRHQLEQMKDEVIDLEDISGGVSITDLGLDEFRTDLLAWTKEHPRSRRPPHGIHAVVQGDQPGIIFVLRNVNPGVNVSKGNRLHPFYLVYVGEDGTVLADQMRARDTLSLMRALCRGRTEPDLGLCKSFNKLTKDGRDMREPSKLLDDAVASIVRADQESMVDSFFGSGVSSIGEHQVKGLDDFELLDFLVVV